MYFFLTIIYIDVSLLDENKSNWKMSTSQHAQLDLPWCSWWKLHLWRDYIVDSRYQTDDRGKTCIFFRVCSFLSNFFFFFGWYLVDLERKSLVRKTLVWTHITIQLLTFIFKNNSSLLSYISSGVVCCSYSIISSIQMSLSLTAHLDKGRAPWALVSKKLVSNLHNGFA